jgi:flavoprotein
MTTNALNVVLSLIANDPTLATIAIDQTWVAANVLYAVALLERNTFVKKLTVDVDSIIETCGEVVVQKLVDTLSKNESIRFLKCKNCNVGAYMKINYSVRTSQTLRMSFWLNLNKLLASSQTPMSVLPHILSKLSSSGCDSIMFQILKEKSDILIGSR